MRKIARYIMIILTMTHYILAFIIPTLVTGVSVWIAMVGYILLLPVTSIPVILGWSLFNDWDKPWTGADPRSWL